MLLVLLLAAILATDVAVAFLFLSTRSRPGQSPRAELGGAVSSEIDEMVVRLRMQVEQATAEIGRQKSELRRMLAGIDPLDTVADATPAASRPGVAAANSAASLSSSPSLPQPPRAAGTNRTASPALDLAAPVSREQVAALARQGLPARAIAGRTGVSVEEVRLLLAMEEPRASA